MCNKHCKAELRKHVLPTFWRPAPTGGARGHDGEESTKGNKSFDADAEDEVEVDAVGCETAVAAEVVATGAEGAGCRVFARKLISINERTFETAKRRESGSPFG